MRDGTLTVFGAPLALLAGVLVAGVLRNGPPPLDLLWPVVYLVLLSLFVSGCAWVTVTLPAASLASAWQVDHPFLVLLLGPTVGAAGGVVALFGGLAAFGGSMSATALIPAAGFGVVSIGLPWMAYTAVRKRGRSGLGVVAATLGWVFTMGALVGAWSFG